MKANVCGKWKEYDKRPTFYDLAREMGKIDGHDILLAVDGRKLRELFQKVPDGAEVSFLTYTDVTAYDTYRRSCVMLFEAAITNLKLGEHPNAFLHFSLGSGFYLTMDEQIICDEALAKKIEGEMRRLVKKALPFEKRSIKTADAIRLFRERGMHDKEKLFRTRIASRVNIYTLDGYEDYYYGYMVHDTSVLKYFEVIPFSKGFILNMPRQSDPETVVPWTGSVMLHSTQLEGETWSAGQGIRTVADLNERIIYGGIGQTVLTAEAMQEGRLSRLAEMISARRGVKFVLIAGPSSSGKTTFSQRLCMQLAAHGMRPHYIGVDNYFRNRGEMKPGPDGRIDFEGLQAVDVEQFNKDLKALLMEETIQVPTFDFLEGKRVYTGETLRLYDEDLLVIEGIHCLNDDLTYQLPAESKFRVYISALTQINIDEHNRVPSADARLIRRIVRDNRTRGYPAAKTLAMWDLVRAGEEKNIFPYQDSADEFFNTALPYELSVMKTYVVPLLFQVTEEDPGYMEARRLLKFLDYIISIPADEVPKNSLLREFIGGGCFRL